MRRAVFSVGVLFFSVAFAADTPAKAAQGFVGEGQGYKPTDAPTESYMVGDAPSPNAAASAPAAPKAVVPAPAAAPIITATAAIPPSAPIPARAETPARNAPASEAAKPAGRQSLWNGLVQPLSMPGASAAAADPDAARAEADRDYETHILGMKAAPSRGSLAARPTPAPAQSIASARAAGGKIFVSFALDPREAGSLRDAVAGLGSSVGFSPDPRFQAMPGPGGTVLYSGWIPAGRLGDAANRPGVKSLRVEALARPSHPSATSGEFLIGLRLIDAARAQVGMEAGVKALTSAADFRLTRVVGLETAPDGRAVAVVEGILPLSRLSRAMGLDEVAKIVPADGGSSAAAAPAVQPEADGAPGFAGFAVRHGAWLIVLTLLLLLPTLRGPARRVFSIFTPYH